MSLSTTTTHPPPPLPPPPRPYSRFECSFRCPWLLSLAREGFLCQVRLHWARGVWIRAALPPLCPWHPLPAWCTGPGLHRSASLPGLLQGARKSEGSLGLPGNVTQSRALWAKSICLVTASVGTGTWEAAWLCAVEGKPPRVSWHACLTLFFPLDWGGVLRVICSQSRGAASSPNSPRLMHHPPHLEQH